MWRIASELATAIGSQPAEQDLAEPKQRRIHTVGKAALSEQQVNELEQVMKRTLRSQPNRYPPL